MSSDKTILNIGSCCIDHVYHVNDFVRPGETLACDQYEVHPGGKGLNQSVAIAKAGGKVRHAGSIGKDGAWLRVTLEDAGVDTSLLQIIEGATGHANIQVNASGENAIVLYGGTNRAISDQAIKDWISSCRADDFLVLQNEISGLPVAMESAAARGLRTIFNAAPITRDVSQLPLKTLDMLIINEVEGEALAGCSSPADILQTLSAQLPETNIVLTLGADGVRFKGPAGSFEAMAPRVTAFDTTGAGDTFTGYLVANYANGLSVEDSLNKACRAAAISVTRRGAASSIPERKEVESAAL